MTEASSPPPLDIEAGAPPPAGALRRRSIAGNAVFSLLNQIVGAVFTAGLTIFLARRLGSHGYGVLSLGLGISALVLLPSDFGTSNSVSRFVTDHLTDRRRVQAVMADGLRLKLGAGLTVSILLFALAGPIAGWYRVPMLAWPVRALSITVFARSVMMIGGVFIAIGRTDLQVWTSLAESSVQVTTAIALVLAGAGATGAAFGWAAGYLAGAVLTLMLLVRALGAAILPRGLRFGPDAGRIAGYAGALLIVDAAYTVFNSIDVLVIGGFRTAAAVALFSAPLQVIVALGYPGMAVASAVAPRLSRGNPGGPDVGAFLGGLRLLLIVQALFTAVVLGWGPLIVRIGFGHDYTGAGPVLRALAPYVFLTGFGSFVSISANYLGKARTRIPIAVAAMLVNAVVDLVLVPRLGVIGASWGTDAAFMLYAPAHLWICARALDLDLAATGKTFARVMLAGALTTGILLVFGDSLAPGHLVATIGGGVIGTGAFVLVLYLSDELTSRDLALARGSIRRLRREACAATAPRR